MTAISVGNILSGARAESHVVATSGAKTLSLGLLRAAIACNASRIATHGARRGLLVCDDSFQFLVGMLALLQAGANVILPPNAQSGTLESLRDAFDLLVTDSTRYANDGMLLQCGGAELGPWRIAAENARIDFFTSGSTSDPKRVEKTLSSLEREAFALESQWGAFAGDANTAGTVTHQHIYGLAFKVMWPFLAGRCFSAPVHMAWESLLAELAPGSIIVSSPAHLTRVSGIPALQPRRRPRMVISAGAPLPPTAARETSEIFGIAPTEIFGSTETGAVGWRPTHTEDSSWEPLPGVEVAANGNGLLRVRSSYTFGADWCELADRITLDANGRFRTQGRADRIVKVEGKRVSLPLLEQVISGLPWIADVALAMVPPDNNVLGAVAILSKQGEKELARLGKFRFERMIRRAMSQTHEGAALPRRWRFVNSIPVDGMGKRRNRDLAALLA